MILKIYTLENLISDHGEIPFCQCGCRNKVNVKPDKNKSYIIYKRNGYPKFIKGHYIRVNNPMSNPDFLKKIQGCGNGMFGKHHKEESNLKNRHSQPYLGKHLPEDHKRKILENQISIMGVRFK